MEAAASTATSIGQFTAAVGIATASRRNSAARAPILGTVVTNAATGAERRQLQQHVELGLPLMGSHGVAGQADDHQGGAGYDDADGVGGGVDGIAGAEVGGGGPGRGEGGGGQRGQAGRRGHQPDRPLPAAGQPGSGEQPGHGAGGQDELRGERAEFFLHRVTSAMRGRAAGSMNSSRNRGAIPMTTDTASSGMMLTASAGRRSPNAAGVPGASGSRSGPRKTCCSARRNNAAEIRMP